MTLENSLNFLGLGFLISEMKDLEKNISKAPVLKFWEISFCLSLLVSLAFMQSTHTSHSYSFKTCSVHITPFLRTLPFIQRTSPGPVGPTWPVLLAAVLLRPYLLFPAPPTPPAILDSAVPCSSQTCSSFLRTLTLKSLASRILFSQTAALSTPSSSLYPNVTCFKFTTASALLPSCPIIFSQSTNLIY